MDPTSSEADAKQLDLARKQGEAYREALDHMAQNVAHDGGMHEAGQYLVGYAIEEAEGMYEWVDGKLEWRAPEEENLHVEIAVCDASDGRLVPGLTVYATLVDPDGNEVGTYEHPLLWHPMIYHYGRNWTVPSDGEYTLRVRVEPPQFMRHDEINGCRFTEPVEVEFSGVQVERGQDEPHRRAPRPQGPWRPRPAPPPPTRRRRRRSRARRRTPRRRCRRARPCEPARPSAASAARTTRRRRRAPHRPARARRWPARRRTPARANRRPPAT